MLGLTTKQLAVVVTGIFHLILIFFFAISEVEFDPDKDWSYLRMSMKEYEIPKPKPKADEVFIPKDYQEHGLEQRKYSVAQTNKAVNSATKEISKGERERMDAEIDAEVARLAREASNTGLLSNNKDGSLTGSIGEDKKKEKAKEDKKAGQMDGKTDLGNTHDKATNITYFLENRTEGPIGLSNPVYVCEKGGKVVVEIVVNPFGEVLSTRVNTSLSATKDQCLYEAARDAARMSTFNKDLNAADKQRGTITYVFVSQ